MRRDAKADANQPEITAALRRVGATVFVTSAMGGGFPDLVVGFRKGTFMLEIKDGSKPPSARKLTPDQVTFHRSWRGSPVQVVCSVVEALRAIGVEWQEGVNSGTDS